MSPTKTARRRSRTSGATIALVLVAAVLVIAAVVAALSGRGGDDRPATAAIEISGDPLPRFEQGAAEDPAVGLPAPELEGQDFEGGTVSVQRDDSPQVVLFLAHWCPVCQDEVRQIQSWLDEGNESPVPITAVSTGTDSSQPNYPPAAWFEREGWEVETVLDDSGSPAGQAYGLPAYPFFVFVDSEGNVVRRHAGAVDVAQFEQFLQALAES